MLHYLEAIRIDPFFYEAYTNLASTYRDAGAMEEAIQAYQAAIRLRPNVADVHSHLASTFKDLGRIPEAVRRLPPLQPPHPSR